MNCLASSYIPSTNYCYLKSTLRAGIENSFVYGAVRTSLAETTLGRKPTTPTIKHCPAEDGSDIEVQGQTYTVACSTDYRGGDEALVYAPTYGICLENCAATTDCIAVAYDFGSSGLCWLKNVLNTGIADGNIMGAKLKT